MDGHVLAWRAWRMGVCGARAIALYGSVSHRASSLCLALIFCYGRCCWAGTHCASAYDEPTLMYIIQAMFPTVDVGRKDKPTNNWRFAGARTYGIFNGGNNAEQNFSSFCHGRRGAARRRCVTIPSPAADQGAFFSWWRRAHTARRSFHAFLHHLFLFCVWLFSSRHLWPLYLQKNLYCLQHLCHHRSFFHSLWHVSLSHFGFQLKRTPWRHAHFSISLCEHISFARYVCILFYSPRVCIYLYVLR